MTAALDGLTLLAAPHRGRRGARHRARRARCGRQRPTVGIVTPDRNLARRIAAELMRFGIEVDDSAGTPLFQSRGRPAGAAGARRRGERLRAGRYDRAPAQPRRDGRASSATRSGGSADALDYDLRGELLKPGIDGPQGARAAMGAAAARRALGARSRRCRSCSRGPMRAAVLADAVLSAVRAIAVDRRPFPAARSSCAGPRSLRRCPTKGRRCRRSRSMRCCAADGRLQRAQRRAEARRHLHLGPARSAAADRPT